MKFEEGNNLSHGKDHASWYGIPAGVEFEPTYLGNGLIRLVAPNYGGSPYGGGAIYIHMNKHGDIPPPKPKRKVKKVVEGWVRLFTHPSGNKKTAGPFDSPVKPGEGICLPHDSIPSNRWQYIGEHFIRHEYEVEED